MLKQVSPFSNLVTAGRELAEGALRGSESRLAFLERDRHRLVRTIRKRIVDHIEGIRRMAAAGDPAFVRIVHKGHLRRPVRDLRLIDYERHVLEYALR